MTKNCFLMFLYLGALQGIFTHINNNSRTDKTYHKYTITFCVITLIFKNLSTLRHFESDFLTLALVRDIPIYIVSLARDFV